MLKHKVRFDFSQQQWSVYLGDLEMQSLISNHLDAESRSVSINTTQCGNSDGFSHANEVVAIFIPIFYFFLLYLAQLTFVGDNMKCWIAHV